MLHYNVLFRIKDRAQESEPGLKNKNYIIICCHKKGTPTRARRGWG